MKPVEQEKNVIEEIVDLTEHHYRCRNCGEEDCGLIDWTEVAYGTASLVSLDGRDYDNYDTEGSENFRVTRYYCGECDHGGDTVEEIFEEVRR